MELNIIASLSAWTNIFTLRDYRVIQITLVETYVSSKTES